jgi:hypothetical protein
MGFYRQGQPPSLNRAEVTAVVRCVAEELAFAIRTADPFNIETACPYSQTGHDFIACCGEVVCAHNCGAVAWA